MDFVTIPSANLFELHCSTQSLCVQQAELNNKLDTINRNIRSINSSTQTGHCRGCWTVSWHFSVQKKHTKRSRKTQNLNIVQNFFGKIYMMDYMQHQK